MKKHRGAKNPKSAPRSLLFGVLFSFAALIIISFVSSAFLMMGENPGGSVKGASLTVLLISAAISGFAVSKYKGEGGFGISLISALAAVVIMLAVSLISSGGKISGASLMNYLCYALVAAFTAFLGKRREGRRRRR